MIVSRVIYDLDVLRSFSAGIALGSYARAADRLGRSTSAVSAQLKKLESQAGTPLLRKAGRGLELTEAGETMLAYAHRLLELNDEAVAAVNGTSLQFGTYTADAGLKGGRFIVTVKAQVKNVSDKPVPVPPVRVRLYDGTLQQFNSVLIQAGDLVVAPNATRTLTFDVNDPKNQVASLDLGFDLEAMKAMKNHPAAKTKAPVAAHAVAENGSEDTAPHDAPAAIATPPAAMDTDNGEGASAGGQDADAQPLSNRSSPELRTALPPSQAHGTGHG